MAGIAVAESSMGRKESAARKTAKMLDHLEVHRGLKGGHLVRHIYTNYEHTPREYHFGEGEGERALSHIAHHAGLSEHLAEPALAEEPEESD